jgi:hypothetical protein
MTISEVQSTSSAYSTLKDLMRWTRLRLTVNPLEPIASRIANMQISRIMRECAGGSGTTKVLTDLLEEFRDRKRHWP